MLFHGDETLEVELELYGAVPKSPNEGWVPLWEQLVVGVPYLFLLEADVAFPDVEEVSRDCCWTPATGVWPRGMAVRSG